MGIAIFIMNIFICGSYSRAATISTNLRSLRCLFEGGYYSKCGVYLRKYVICCVYVSSNGKCSPLLTHMYHREQWLIQKFLQGGHNSLFKILGGAPCSVKRGHSKGGT